MTLSAAQSLALADLGYNPQEQGLLDRLVAEQAADLEWLEAVEQAYPLACSVLWRADAAPCDQRRSVAAVMRAPTVGLVLGGERSGKSRGLKELTLAMALGGDHPVTQAWLTTNDLPRDAIPDGPAEVYAVALTSSDSMRYHRPDFAALVGALPHQWHNQTGNGESRLVIAVPGYRRQGIIHFKSIDQKAKSFQGISIRWAWVDEEPEGHEGKAVYGQLRARVMDQSGRIGISMVPMNGYTWVHDDLIRKRQDDAVHVELDTLDNPHLPKERAARHFSGMDEDEKAMRRYGRFRSRAGAVYPLWNVGDGLRDGMGHTCAPFAIPRDWTRFRGVDFGLTNPTAVVWGALGDDDTLYIYREYYIKEAPSYPWHALRIRALELGQSIGDKDSDYAIQGDPLPEEERETIEAGYADPSNPGAILDFANHDIYCGRADNDVKAGISAVGERLRLQGDQRPRIKVFTNCTNLIHEMGGYLRDPNKIDGAPLKRDDHCVDSLRYLIMGIKAWKGI